MKLFKTQALLALTVLCMAKTVQANWVTIDFPGAAETHAHGIDGESVVGS